MWKSPITSTSCGGKIWSLSGTVWSAKNSPPSLFSIRSLAERSHVVFRGVAMTSLIFAHAENTGEGERERERDSESSEV